MHILLTDILTCPQCGPDQGLILLADRIEDRRVLTGRLGCANCQRTYPVRDGVVDFRDSTEPGTSGSGPDTVRGPEAAPQRDVERLAAMLGVVSGPAFLLLVGPVCDDAPALAAMLEEVEVITISADAPMASPGVNPLLIDGGSLPVARSKVAAVALTGAAVDPLLEEGARVIEPGGRLVLDPVPPDAGTRLGPLGVRVAAQERATVVAIRG